MEKLCHPSKCKFVHKKSGDVIPYLRLAVEFLKNGEDVDFSYNGEHIGFMKYMGEVDSMDNLPDKPYGMVRYCKADGALYVSIPDELLEI